MQIPPNIEPMLLRSVSPKSILVYLLNAISICTKKIEMNLSVDVWLVSGAQWKTVEQGLYWIQTNVNGSEYHLLAKHGQP